MGREHNYIFKKNPANENNRNESFYRFGTWGISPISSPRWFKILPGDLAPNLSATVWEPQSSCCALNVTEGGWDTQEKSEPGNLSGSGAWDRLCLSDARSHSEGRDPHK